MRKRLPMLVVLSLAACDLAHDPETVSQSSQLELISEWSANVTGVGSSPITGSAAFREFGSYFDAEISISGALPNRAYQWRIYEGSCAATTADELEQFGGTQSYPDLVTDAAGTVSRTRMMAGALNSPDSVYSVRFRVSVSSTNWNGTNPVACGNLQHP